MTARVFHVSPSYIRRQQARQLGWMLVMLGLVGLSLYYLVQVLSGETVLVDLLVPVLGVVACSAYVVKLVLQLKLGRAGYPDVIWDAEAETLSLQPPTGPVVLAMNSILSLRVQVGFGSVIALTLTTESGEQLKLEGYAALDELVDLLEHRLPEGQVVRTRLRY